MDSSSSSSDDKSYVGDLDLICDKCGEVTPVAVFAWMEANPDDLSTSYIATSADTEALWFHQLTVHNFAGELE